MKSPLLSAIVLIPLVLGCSAVAQAQTVQSVFNEGVALFQQEDYVNALEKFEKILRAKPDHVYSRNYATKCRAAIAKGAKPANDTEAKLESIIIPQIDLSEAPIGDVLVYLTNRAEELTDGKYVPNFIYQGTSEQRKNTLITLNLRGVPMTEAIRYIGQLSRTDFRYDPHAIVATPRGNSQPAQSSGPTETEEKPGTVLGEKPKRVFD